MHFHELAHPDLKGYVRYRVLAPPEVDMLVAERDEMSKDAFVRLVVEAVIYNLPEITDSLRTLPKERAKEVLASLCNGAFMINPGLDPQMWNSIADKRPTPAEPAKAKKKPVPAPDTKKLPRDRYVTLERSLKDRVIGQDQAVEAIVNALKRSLAGLGDENRPLGVFLFAGASGTGKTLTARELQKQLFGDAELVRVDCGEYQHKHDNSKLLGSPPGYIGYDDGSKFAAAVKKNPGTVVLLDEVEKAHPDLWNTFLRVFDEGILTDSSGAKIDFRNTIIIMTTNLGNKQVVDETLGRKLGFANADLDLSLLPVHTRVERLANEAIRKMFSPEFLNRIDKVIAFNHLTTEDMKKIAEIELSQVDSKLAKKGFSFQYDETVVIQMVENCDSIQGARKLSTIRRDEIENQLAELLLTHRYPRGTLFSLVDGYHIQIKRPSRAKAVKT